MSLNVPTKWGIHYVVAIAVVVTTMIMVMIFWIYDYRVQKQDMVNGMSAISVVVAHRSNAYSDYNIDSESVRGVFLSFVKCHPAMTQSDLFLLAAELSDVYREPGLVFHRVEVTFATADLPTYTNCSGIVTAR